MKDDFEKNSRVILKTFQNTTIAPSDTDESENYWKLIGLTGKVASDEKKVHPAFKDKGERVIVEFDEDIKSYGLHSHNEIPNTIWLFVSDLEELD
jgi:hypothetical protein